jgi:hypothetical protein
VKNCRTKTFSILLNSGVCSQVPLLSSSFFHRFLPMNVSGCKKQCKCNSYLFIDPVIESCLLFTCPVCNYCSRASYFLSYKTCSSLNHAYSIHIYLTHIYSVPTYPIYIYLLIFMELAFIEFSFKQLLFIHLC